jgi:hypothetical protein
MLLGLRDEAGLNGGWTLLRPRSSTAPFAFEALSSAFSFAGTGRTGSGCGAGGVSSIGESGGGGIEVPSVRE